MSDDRFYYGQGRVSLAEIDATTGAVGLFQYVGDASVLTPKFSVDKIQHTESNSGQLGLAASFDGKRTGTIDITMHSINADNVAKFTRGTVVQTTAGTVTAEVLPNALVLDDIVYLRNPGASAIVITDSNATPATLVEGTDYFVEDANFGRIRIGNPASFTQPFKAAYSFTDRRTASFFKTGQKNYALKFEGLDLANGNAAVMVDFYKVAPSVLQQLDLITTGNDVASMQVSSDILIDSSKPATGDLGQFGSISYIGVAA